MSDPEDHSFKKVYPSDLENDAEAQFKSFCNLLNDMEMDEKLKVLWKQIYKNAVDDRKHAMIVWTDLYMQVHGNPEMHALHGDRIAKYMERMEKANTQILKLAELVQKLKSHQEEQQYPKGNDFFDQLDAEMGQSSSPSNKKRGRGTA